MGYLRDSIASGVFGRNRGVPLDGSTERANSLVEMVIAIGVLGLVLSIGGFFVGSATSSAKSSKLETDTQSLNRAVTMYVASGGDLTNVNTPAAVLAKLKTTSSAARVKTQINPLTSALIDPRLEAVLQNDFEAASKEPRSYWNAGEQKFEVKIAGGKGGVKLFQLSEDAAPAEMQVESRKSGSMEFASESGWIWDYKDDGDVIPGPTIIPTSIPVSIVTPPVSVTGTPAASALSPPTFSMPGGTFPAVDFDLSVSLANPNPTGSSRLVYNVGGAAWLDYSGSISVAPGTRVLARALSNDTSRWYDSVASRETYSATLIDLDPPTVSFSDNTFSMTSPTITVTLTDNNAGGLSDLYYDLKDPSGSYKAVQFWQQYTGSFVVNASDYIDGFDIITYAKARDPGLYEHSADVEAHTYADFFGVPVTGDVLLVIDASSSMKASFGSGTRFSEVVSAAALMIPTLRPTQKFNVAMFDGGTHWTDGTFKLHNAVPPKAPELAAQIQSVSGGSGTNYEAALGLPLQYNPVPETMLFLTDGEPSSGGDYSDELAALVAAGVEVRVLGIDLDSSATATVQAIANATGGSVTEIPEP